MKRYKKYILFLVSCIRLARAFSKARVIFIFPFYQPGGAERAHLDIVKALNNKRNIVIFTQPSVVTAFKKDFFDAATCIDFPEISQHRKTVVFFYSLLIWLINKRTTSLSLFSANAFRYYCLLDRIQNPVIRKIDLLHAFSFPDPGIEDTSVYSVPLLDARVVSNEKTRRDYADQYRRLGISPEYLSRIKVIDNATIVPASQPAKDISSQLSILYCGRGTYEKRPQLFIDIAARMKGKALFSMIGDLAVLSDQIRAAGIYYSGGPATNPEIAAAYFKAHVLVLTSLREGFPMVIMEAMAQGIVCICTDVGAISEHICHGENGFLVSGSANEALIEVRVTELLLLLNSDRRLLARLSEAAYRHAQKHFSYNSFAASYRRLLTSTD